MFQPVVPLTGIGGWNFLQATYDRQLQTFADSAQVRNDRDYMTEKLSKPIAVEDFLKDARLMRTTLTAFDLSGEEWKRGFVSKVLKEAATPESSFLARLNNPQYTRFAEALRPVDGKITINPEKIQEIGARFEAASFELAVGEVDNDLRLSLNYQSEIVDIAGSGASDDTILYRMLGSVPVRTVLEGATNLPTDIRKLPIEKQAEIRGYAEVELETLAPAVLDAFSEEAVAPGPLAIDYFPGLEEFSEKLDAWRKHGAGGGGLGAV